MPVVAFCCQEKNSVNVTIRFKLCLNSRKQNKFINHWRKFVLAGLSSTYKLSKRKLKETSGHRPMAGHIRQECFFLFCLLGNQYSLFYFYQSRYNNRSQTWLNVLHTFKRMLLLTNKTCRKLLLVTGKGMVKVLYIVK